MSDSRKPSDTVSEANQHDALSVLRDLVALEDSAPPDSDDADEVSAWLTGYDRRMEAALARARRLVAGHTPDEERQT
jgi:hypothetical protein